MPTRDVTQQGESCDPLDPSKHYVQVTNGGQSGADDNHLASTRKFLQMASTTGQGSTLQGYNNELVKCIEDLREKREELNKLILKDEEDKAKVQKEIAVLTDRLKKVNGKIPITLFLYIFRGTT
jgi:hypothetical protein